MALTCVKVSIGEFFKILWAFKSTLVIILTPIGLCPLPVLIPTSAARCGYVIAIMAIYWITEVVPLAVTALIPMVLFPTLGVLTMKATCANYLSETNMLFVSGLIVATAIEKWNLHKRIALRVLVSVGSKPVWLMFGFMLTTAFLSMWMSNTATTAMMIPIAHAVIVEMLDKRHNIPRASTTGHPEGTTTKGGEKNSGDRGTVLNKRTDYGTQTDFDEEPEVVEVNDLELTVHDSDIENQPLSEPKTDNTTIDMKSLPPEDKDLARGLTLCIAYAANIGGTGTLTGTGPNLVISGQVEALYGQDAVIDFGSWFIYAFPGMVICLFLAWVWLQLQYLDLWRDIKHWLRMCGRCQCAQCCRENCCCCGDKEQKDAGDADVSAVIRKQYKALGPITWAEAAVLGHFIVLACLWLTRDPKFAPGWGIAFTKGYIHDSTAGVMVAIFLFIFPSRPPNFGCLRQRGDESEAKPRKSLLDWHTVNTKLPWNVVILLGGGFAMAQGCKESGLSAWLGQQFVGLAVIPPAAMVAVITVVIAAFTEITSNTSTASIFLPILGELGTSIGVHPFYFMIPATVACSYAFMLPVATPPNAIVFAYGTLTIMDMAKCGLMMNILCLLVVNLSINTNGMLQFDLNTFPDWAIAESTVAVTPTVCLEYIANGTMASLTNMTLTTPA
ncbi:Na(+)/citrate cotransporter-like isoform X2 [Glandiceps talaboti]